MSATFRFNQNFFLKIVVLVAWITQVASADDEKITLPKGTKERVHEVVDGLNKAADTIKNPFGGDAMTSHPNIICVLVTTAIALVYQTII